MSKGHKMSFPLLQKQLKERGRKSIKKTKMPPRSENLGRSSDKFCELKKESVEVNTGRERGS